MRKKYVWLGILMGGISWVPLKSQTNTPVEYRPVYEIPLRHKPYRPSGEIPELYIYSQWAFGEFTASNGERIMDHQLKFELLNGWMEVMVDGEIKLLPLEDLKEFTWVSPETNRVEHYINGDTYRIRGFPAEGIYRVIHEGQHMLLERVEAKLIKPNYVPQLDAGNREYTFERSHILFIEHNGILQEVPKRKKHFLELFGGYSSEIKTYIKKERLNIRLPQHLIQVITQYEKLIKDDEL